MRLGHDAGIAGEDAVDVGENLAGVGIQSSSQGDRGEISAATAERGRVAIGILTLKAGDDDDVIVGQQLVNLFRRDICNPRSGVGAIGQDAGFSAGQ